VKSIGFALLLITALSGFTSKRFCGAEAALRLSHHKTIAIMPVTVKCRWEKLKTISDSNSLSSLPDYQNNYYNAVKALEYPVDTSRHHLIAPKTSNASINLLSAKDSLPQTPQGIGKALHAQALMYTNIKEGRHDLVNVVRFIANTIIWLSGDWWYVNNNIDRDPRFKVKVISKFIDVKTGKTLYKVKSKRYCRGYKNFYTEANKLLKNQAEYIPYNHYRVIGAGVMK
jgi:hypothetical protein